MNRSEFYTIKGSTADGDIVSESMNAEFERGYISVVFYTDSTLSTLVTPTAGTITFTASESGTGYGTIKNGAVDATIEAYDRPHFSGYVTRVKATCSGVTGAGYYVATVARFGG